MTIAGGSEALATSALTAGTHTITAVYGSDANNTTSTSSPLTQLVNVVVTLSGPLAVPTLSEWSLGLLTSLLLLLGLGRQWRRRGAKQGL